MTTFTKTIEALQARNRNEWDVADALLVEVSPSRVGVRNSSKGTWEQLAQVLADEGIEYSVSTLRQYRDAAAKWAPDNRVEGVSFTAHRYASKASDPVAVITNIKKLKGKVTTADVKAAVASPQSKSQKQKAATQIVRAARKALVELKRPEAKAAAATNTGLSELEDLLTELTRTRQIVVDTIAATKTPTRKGAVKPAAKTPVKPTAAVKKPAASSTSAKPARRGRARG